MVVPLALPSVVAEVYYLVADVKYNGELKEEVLSRVVDRVA